MRLRCLGRNTEVDVNRTSGGRWTINEQKEKISYISGKREWNENC